jgi:hypothetical protein
VLSGAEKVHLLHHRRRVGAKRAEDDREVAGLEGDAITSEAGPARTNESKPMPIDSFVSINVLLDHPQGPVPNKTLPRKHRPKRSSSPEGQQEKI